MDSTIYVFTDNQYSEKFLRNFFRHSDQFQSRFFKSPDRFISTIKKNGTVPLIIESPHQLGRIASQVTGNPLIAIIPEDIQGGLQCALKHNANALLVAPFGEEDLRQKITVALEGKNWLKKLYEEKKDIEAILDISQMINSLHNPHDVLYCIVEKISEMINVDRCSIISFRLDDANHAYVISSFEDKEMKEIELDLAKYPEIRHVIMTREPLFILDAIEDPLMKSVKKFIEPLHIKSILVIPILYKNEVIGTLYLRTSRKRQSFTEREIKLCHTIANISGNALSNAFLFLKMNSEKSKLMKLSITDFLTGIYNIRYFYHRLEVEFSRAERYGYPFHASCLILTTLNPLMMTLDIESVTGS